MLVIFYSIITHNIASKWMCHQIKVCKIIHSNPPFFKIFIKIINWLLRSKFMLFIVFRSTASSHSNNINQYEMKFFHHWFEHLMKHCARPSITMYQHKSWFIICWLATNDCSNSNRFLFKLTNLDILHNNQTRVYIRLINNSSFIAIQMLFRKLVFFIFLAIAHLISKC